MTATENVSTARSEAARRNGAKSHGPKTDDGKLRSSQNSTKHGMYARSIVLPGESQEDYDYLRDAYLAEFAPSGPTENHEVETMLNAEWRIRRLRNMETSAVAHKMPDHRKHPHDAQVAYSYNWAEKTVNCVFSFEPRLQRDYDRALRRLLDLQKRRQKQQNEPKPLPPPAEAEDPIPAPEKTRKSPLDNLRQKDSNLVCYPSHAADQSSGLRRSDHDPSGGPSTG